MNNRRNIFIVILLIFIWVFATQVYLRDQEYSLTTLENRHNSAGLTISRSGEMLTGDKVVGNFHSDFPNLGIVALRFYTFYRSNKDIIRFSIKENGSEDWYYSAAYNTDQFKHNKLFPFGFPLIKDSENKNYTFEIESLRGATGSGVFVHPTFPAFIDHHVYTKKDILSAPQNAIDFIFNKMINLAGDEEFVYNAVNFLLPLIAFLIFLELGNFLTLSFLITSSITMWQVFSTTEFHYFATLSVSFYWICLSIKHKLSFKISLLLALFYFILGIILLIFGQIVASENSAIWAFLLLLVSSVIVLCEYFRSDKEEIGVSQFISYIHLFLLNIAERVMSRVNIQSKYLSKFRKRIKKRSGGIDGMTLPSIPLLKGVVYLKQTMSNKITAFIVNTAAIAFSLYLFPKIIRHIIDLRGMYLEYYKEAYLFPYIENVIIKSLFFIIIPLFISVIFYKSLKSLPITIMGFFLLTSLFIPQRIGKSSAMINEPKILYISPSATQEAWTDVSVVGKNFRDKPFVGKIYIDGVEQGVYVVDWTDERVIFRTSPEITKSGMVQVIPLEGKPSNKVQFNYNYK